MGRQTTTVAPVNLGQASGGATQLNTSETVYDPGGRVSEVCTYPAGQSCSYATNSSVLSTPPATGTGYDALGRVISSTLTTNTTPAVPAQSTANAYNADGTLHTTALTAGGAADTFAYAYDSLARVETVTRGSTVQTSFSYNSDGTVATRTDGSWSGALGTSSFGYVGMITSSGPTVIIRTGPTSDR
jgi:uncharacterized protein RhaS with RHS repeats